LNRLNESEKGYMSNRGSNCAIRYVIIFSIFSRLVFVYGFCFAFVLLSICKAIALLLVFLKIAQFRPPAESSASSPAGLDFLRPFQFFRDALVRDPIFNYAEFCVQKPF
jgi:hypothetical protein